MLAIELIQNPNADDAEATRRQVLTSLAITESHGRHSVRTCAYVNVRPLISDRLSPSHIFCCQTIARKGAKLLKLLLERERILRETTFERRPKKRRVASESRLDLPSLLCRLAHEAKADEVRELRHKSRRSPNVDDSRHSTSTALDSTFLWPPSRLREDQRLSATTHRSTSSEAQPDESGSSVFSEPTPPQTLRPDNTRITPSLENIEDFSATMDFYFDFTTPQAGATLPDASADVFLADALLSAPAITDLSSSNILAGHDQFESTFSGIFTGPSSSRGANLEEYLPNDEEWILMMQRSGRSAQGNVVDWSHLSASGL